MAFINNFNLDSEQARVLTLAIDSALQGSEYGIEAWKEFRAVLLNDGDVDLDRWNRIVDLVDRAVDDVKGPGLRVDMSLDRIYSIGKQAKENA